MSEETVKIEINGRPLEARKGAMLIEVADEAGIYIPRFCYHKKLSTAANCRMCLVEVERAVKPVAACATPVMDGMKVHTDSPKALAAQRGNMEFLLINHPLDCPICDQGGECELQDVAMGYGRDVSQYQERKRVVKDKDIGPLIKTEMTRCIHCTRCVRFGEEIANLRELGATGRGEHTQIGTYVEQSLVSELAGNVVDLCPVGALTAKPSRYTGRSWEYVQHAGVSPHDCVGSNLYLHTYQGRVMRVVPRENEAVNEVWIADRDRFSYEGLYSADRATVPLVKGAPVEWEAALAAAAGGLKAIIASHGPEAVGVLASPSATLEELYLLQQLARGLGIANLDHRLRQADFSDQEWAPVYPWLGLPLAHLEQLQAALLIGSNVRMEQPLIAHRLRKAGKKGARLMAINPRDFEFYFPLAARLIVDPAGMIRALAGVTQAVLRITRKAAPEPLKALLKGLKPNEEQRHIAEYLLRSQRAAVLLGNLAIAHPAFSTLRALAACLAERSGATLAYLPEGANGAGGWLAGVLPHRVPGGRPAPVVGLDARAMLESPRKAYILLGVEPEFDCWDTATALQAVQGAEFVLSLSAYTSPTMCDYADVVLPIAAFAETDGSFVNAEGRCQSFTAVTKPLGEARPAWKVLRVLANTLQLPGFDYLTAQQVLDAVLEDCKAVEPDNRLPASGPLASFNAEGLLRLAEVPIYAVDATVRRAASLQQTVWAGPATASLHPRVAEQLGLNGADRVVVRQNGREVVLPLVLDESVPANCVCVPAGLPATAVLGARIGPVEITVA